MICKYDYLFPPKNIPPVTTSFRYSPFSHFRDYILLLQYSSEIRQAHILIPFRCRQFTCRRKADTFQGENVNYISIKQILVD